MSAGPVGVVGAGYVGLTTAACLSHLGHSVRCVDSDVTRVERLRQGVVDILEPRLVELVHAGLRGGTVCFDTELGALTSCGVVVLCLPTPSGRDGAPDLASVTSVSRRIAREIAGPVVLAVKSTVPPGSARTLQDSIGRGRIDVVSNPEFLREGRSVADFLRPERIVVGGADSAAVDAVTSLYRSVPAPIFRTDWASAELAKYACNSFLAVKASYTNELADLCSAVGADVTEVTAVMAADPRIGGAFLAPGPGWGGSCLPKDTCGMLDAGRRAGVVLDTVRAAVQSNARHRRRLVADIVRELTGEPAASLAGYRIGVLGLTFKAGTGDVRESPALAVVHELCVRGAVVTAYDPACGSGRASAVDAEGEFQVVDEPAAAVKSASAVVVLTEWLEFRTVDWRAAAREVQRPLVIDARNLLDPAALEACGFSYRGIGRP